jgi:probable 4-oxalomesaconate hydratase
MTKNDVFAHVLLPEFYERMLMMDPDLPKKMPFIQNPVLSDMELRRKLMPEGVKQVISYVNANPEDYANKKVAPLLVNKINE